MRKLFIIFYFILFNYCDVVFAQVINEDLKILAGDGEADDRFGQRVDLDNGMAVILAPGDDDNGASSGSAYVVDVITGVLISKLLPADGAAFNSISSVAIDNGIVVLGSSAADDNGNNSGAVYLFDALSGLETIKLLPNDGASRDGFGNSVAISNGIVAVGASMDDTSQAILSGSAYLFNASTGIQIAKLLPSDLRLEDRFGSKVAIDGDVVAVGMTPSFKNSALFGSVYLFNASNGVQIAKVFPDDIENFDRFGLSIDLDGGILAASEKRTRNGVVTGLVYLFNAQTGLKISEFVTNQTSGVIATNTSISDGVAVVSGLDSAFIFDITNGLQIGTLGQSDGEVGDCFGCSAVISNGIVVVGATYDGDNGIDAGSAYVFSVSSVPCLADITGDREVDFFDISAFLTAFGALDPIADFTGDGSFDFFDISAFLTAFSAGCP